MVTAFQAKKNRVMRLILESGGLSIRDLNKGQEPFLYSSGNRGPGYIDIKGRVGFDEVFEAMLDLLADLLIMNDVDFELIVGMMTGGAIPGFRLKQIISRRKGIVIPYIYQRGARKKGGHGELDTGDRENFNIPKGCKVLIVEELVNFAETVTQGALYERNKKGRLVTDVATILFYQNPVAIERLLRYKLALHYIIGLKDDLLPFAQNQGFASKNAVKSYFEFLDDPKAWNEVHGFEFSEGI